VFDNCNTNITFIKPVRYSVEDKLCVTGSCHLDGVAGWCGLVVEIVLVHEGLERGVRTAETVFDLLKYHLY